MALCVYLIGLKSLALTVVAFGSNHVLSNSSAQFRIFWCLSTMLSLLPNLRAHRAFYKWYHVSNLKTNEVRGLGNSPSAVYGIPASWIALSMQQFEMVGLLLSLSFAASIMYGWCLCPVFLLYLVYAVQISTETNFGNRKSLTIPCTALYLFLAGDDADWGLQMLKIHLVSMYFFAGFIKVIASVILQAPWINGTTFQYYLFEAICCRPGDDRITSYLQALLFRSRILCICASTGGLMFELIAPLALFSREFAHIYTVVAIMFHMGVYLLQGINFVDYFAPSLMVFILMPDPVSVEQMWIHSDSWCFRIALLHLCMQLLVAFTFADVWIQTLPFTCCPMFSSPHSLASGDSVQWFVMVDVNLRMPGHLDYIQWVLPAGIGMGINISEEELRHLPFKVVMFGFPARGGLYAQYLRSFKWAESNDIWIHGNVHISAELHRKICALCRRMWPEHTQSTWDRKILSDMSQLRSDTFDMFRASSISNAPRLLRAVSDNAPVEHAVPAVPKLSRNRTA